jgi:hypothetical protein
MLQIYFSPEGLRDRGWELYSGEAMLALMVAYGRLQDHRYLTAVEKAYPQYAELYRAGAKELPPQDPWVLLPLLSIPSAPTLT